MQRIPHDNVLHVQDYIGRGGVGLILKKKDPPFFLNLSWCCSRSLVGWIFSLSFQLTDCFSVSDPFDLVKYISIIRKLYDDREGWLAPFPWCEEFRFDLDTIFTRLKFVSRKNEREIETDDIVDMFQIFQPHQECSQPRRVLIEGPSGMGKTCLLYTSPSPRDA